MATAKTTTLTFRIEPALKDALIASERPELYCTLLHIHE